jgi:hypothetical protein
MINSLILGIGSKARIGKDYAATQLAKLYDLERIAFADAVKRDLASIFKKCGLDYWAIDSQPAEKEKIRPLLVEYGCTMRAFNEDIWVNRALENVKFEHDITFITDVRFPNEVKRLHERGGFFIYVETDVPPANEVEKLNDPLMKELADFKVKNNFDADFIASLVKIIFEVRPDIYARSDFKDKETQVLWQNI